MGGVSIISGTPKSVSGTISDLKIINEHHKREQEISPALFLVFFFVVIMFINQSPRSISNKPFMIYSSFFVSDVVF